MKKMKGLTVAFSIALAVGCAAPPPDSPEFDPQAVEAEIAEWTNAFWEAWRGGRDGLDRALASFDDHPDFVYAAEGTRWSSFAQVEETFRRAFEIVQSQSIEIQETSITVLSRDHAHFLQVGTYSITDTSGATSEERPFAFSGLLVRTDAGWKLRAGHESEPSFE